MKTIFHGLVIFTLISAGVCTLIAEESSFLLLVIDKFVITPILFRVALGLVFRWKDTDKYIRAWFDTAKNE